MLAAAALVLSACARTWDGDLRFKVDSIHPGYESTGDRRPAYAVVKIGEHPDGMVERIGSDSVDLHDLPNDIKVGDEIICEATQYDASGFDGDGVRTFLEFCRKAS
ncbi:hypothetical protein [Saccharothrix sp.]|uniref:hypothetical protein n=1 Tax=Saccharothrix sp. TaxID=1873460 RepID=UPI0028110F9E|nr:hypothetical protein [Saccharothrix sp.]